MFVTVSEFAKITGISRHTVYSWIYRNDVPAGLEPGKIGVKTHILTVRRGSEHYDKIRKAKEKELV